MLAKVMEIRMADNRGMTGDFLMRFHENNEGITNTFHVCLPKLSIYAKGEGVITILVVKFFLLVL